MTPTEKQKCIAEQAVYNDLMLNRRAYDDVEEEYIIEQVDSKWVLDFINYDKLLSLTPILRPLSDLAKVIRHRGYNDNKPFVPLVELAKISMQDAIRKEYWKPEDFVIKGEHVKLGDYTFSYEKRECFSWSYKYSDLNDQTALYQQSIYDLLHLWHFDTRNLIEKGDAIDVNTLEVNPYEV